MSRDAVSTESYPARVSIAVCGHYRRAKQARELADRVGGRLALDDGTHGELANHDRAWALAVEADEQVWQHALAAQWALDTYRDRWCVVLEDDAIVPDDFAEQAARVLTGAHGLVSFYLGAERPVEWQSRITRAVGVAEAMGASWIASRWLLWGVAVALPVTEATLMLQQVRERKYRPYDERLGAWARRSRIPVRYTWPSLVDHADGPTLIHHADGQPRDAPRRAWATGTPVLGGPVVEL